MKFKCFLVKHRFWKLIGKGLFSMENTFSNIPTLFEMYSVNFSLICCMDMCTCINLNSSGSPVFGRLELFGTLFSEASSNKSECIFRLWQIQNRDHESYKSAWLPHPRLCFFFMWYPDLFGLVPRQHNCYKVAACLSLVQQRIRSQCATGVGLVLSVLNAACANPVCVVDRERPVLCLIPHHIG